MPQVAVVGGGISGLVCATQLTQRGFNVKVFDMGSRHPGGRMSTRKAVWRDMQFDHGCQLISSDNERVLAVLKDWEQQGVVAPWQGTFGSYDAATGAFAQLEDGSESFFGHTSAGPKYVGVPSMSAICTFLAKQLQPQDPDDESQGVSLRTKVQRALRNQEGKWLLEGPVTKQLRTPTDRISNPPYTPWNLGVFDGLVLADTMVARPGAPGHVTITGVDLTPMTSRMQGVGSVPLFTLMLAVDSPDPLFPFDAASVHNSPTIQWIACDSSKPGRERGDTLQCWVALTTEEFAQGVLASSGGVLPPQTPEYLASIAPQIWEGFVQALQPSLGGAAIPEPTLMQCHRWGSAFPAHPLGEACLSDSEARVVACGDFCLGAGVSNAVLSGLEAADRLHAMLS